MKHDVVVQVGATSDASRHYAVAAHSLGFDAWLLDSAERLALLPLPVRDSYDRTITLGNPADPHNVIDALKLWQARVAAVVSGCDPCHGAAHHAALALAAGAPAVRGETVPDKLLQRERINRTFAVERRFGLNWGGSRS